MGPFIYYVAHFLDLLRKHVFSTDNKQKLELCDIPPTSAYVVYEWSLLELSQKLFSPHCDQIRDADDENLNC